LRQSLIDVAGSRLAQEGQQAKLEMVCQFLTGPARIDAIVEKFPDTQDHLDRERKTIMRSCPKRVEQLIGSWTLPQASMTTFGGRDRGEAP
jgi:hypothetical protein